MSTPNRYITNLTHGMRYTPEYRAWVDIKRRCIDPRRKEYARYGGRGILLAPEWLDSFQSFYDHIGPRPSDQHSVDRIDNEGHYEPGNVRWATRTEQANNQRSNRTITHDGETLTYAQWARRLGLSPGAIRRRLDLGWSNEETVTKPRRKQVRR